MKINDAGIAILKEHEGLRMHAYPDPATGGSPWTVGYGHTGSDVYSTLVITAQKAEYLLRCDLIKFEQGVEELLKVPVTSNQFSALVCFSYNVGLGNLKNSTLLKKINEGDSDASEEFLKWDKAAGKVMEGLEKRRQDERDLFIKA